MFILGIESSCDETAAAVLHADEAGVLTERSHAVRSQVALHRPYGGVVPELASRAHIEVISPLTALALSQAGMHMAQLDLVAVTNRPGLIGALLVGVNFAKSLAASYGLPLVAVNHMKAHVAAAYLGAGPRPTPPFVALAVSGGHTSLYLVQSHTDYTELGATRDDAIGEAFDKVGRLLGLSYPAGADFDRLAAEGFALAAASLTKESSETHSPPSVWQYPATPAYRDPALRLPSPALADDTLDLSFSGLKTAAVNLLHRYEQKGLPLPRELFAAAFTYEAVTGVTHKVEAALSRYPSLPLVVAGGVAANSHLRASLQQLTRRMGRALYLPPLSHCGDNAAMVAAQGYYEFVAGNRADHTLNAGATDELSR
ncbi:MAG: tRNA (adenosine(37)-N6)-threonylcarbamoyltransferase complex transferase subunit TsaD [Eubacteriales bacterium]